MGARWRKTICVAKRRREPPGATKFRYPLRLPMRWILRPEVQPKSSSPSTWPQLNSAFGEWRPLQKTWTLRVQMRRKGLEEAMESHDYLDLRCMRTCWKDLVVYSGWYSLRRFKQEFCGQKHRRSRGSPKSEEICHSRRRSAVQKSHLFLGTDSTPEFPTNFPCTCRIEPLPTKATMIPFLTPCHVLPTQTPATMYQKRTSVKTPYGAQLTIPHAKSCKDWWKQVYSPEAI